VGNGSAWADLYDEPSLISIEVRGGYGLSVGGGAGSTNYRLSPVTLSVLGEIAVQTQPWTTIYGGLIMEGSDRAAVGVSAGVRAQPPGSRLRIGAGGVLIFSPYSVYGPSVTLGRCFFDSLRLCSDLEAIVFLAGSDVPDDRVAAQVQLVVGIAFTAL